MVTAMTVMILCSILLAVIYVGTSIWKRRELPESVSAMVYDLPYAWRWLWTLWVWVATYLLMPSLMEALPERWQAVGFLFGASMIFVGGVPLIRDERNTAHNMLGIAAGGLSQLCVWLISPCWIPVWLVMPFLWGWLYVQPHGWLAKTTADKDIFIAETLCWLSLTGSVIFN